MRDENEESEEEETNFEFQFEITQLGLAILKSGLTPEEGLLVYLDLVQANQGIILANELH